MSQFWPPVPPADTGWQTLALDSGATVSGGLTPMIRVVGDRVDVIGRVAQAGLTIATLDASLMPPEFLRFIGNTGSSGSGVAPLVVDPATRTIYTATGTTINLAHSWLTA